MRTVFKKSSASGNALIEYVFPMGMLVIAGLAVGAATLPNAIKILMTETLHGVDAGHGKVTVQPLGTETIGSPGGRPRPSDM